MIIGEENNHAVTSRHHGPVQQQLLPSLSASNLGQNSEHNNSWNRMHIRLNMSEGQYLASTQAPAATAYQAQDMGPYAPVSSYYPATTDSSLLTPVSSSASPSMKGMHYPSQAVAGPQQPTPPNSSGIYYPSYGINHPSSPMTGHPQTPETSFHMNPYVHPSPPAAARHPSPGSEVPPPVNQYLGHYSVSGACSEDGSQNSFGGYPDFNDVGAGFMGRGPPPMHVSAPPSMHPQMAVTAASQQPLLSHHNPGAPFRTTRAGGIEDIGGLYNSHGLPSTLQSATATTPRKRQPRQQQQQQPLRRPRATPMRRGSRNSSRQQSEDQETVASAQPQAAASASPVDPTDRPALRLIDSTPVETKFLIESRQRNVGEKGHGMWEIIAREYASRYTPMSIAALQMRVNRGVAMYGDWPEEELKALVEAFVHDEETRYERLLEKAKNLGLGRVWDWSAAQIETKLVDLGLENEYVDEHANSRRKPWKKRSKPRSKSNDSAAVAGGGDDPTGGLDPQTLMPLQPQQSHHASTSFDLDINAQGADGIITSMPKGRQDKLMDDIFGRGAAGSGSRSSASVGSSAGSADEVKSEPSSPDVMDVSQDGKDDGEQSPQQQPLQEDEQQQLESGNGRVAARRCERLRRSSVRQ